MSPRADRSGRNESVPGWNRSELGFERGELGDAAGVAAALELGGQEHVDDLVREAEPDDSGADGQHIGIVVLARHSCRVEAVAECRTSAADLVRGELFALAAPPEHDADVGAAVANLTGSSCAELGIVDTLRRVGPAVDDLVAGRGQAPDQVLLEFETRMV